MGAEDFAYMLEKNLDLIFGLEQENLEQVVCYIILDTILMIRLFL